MSPNIIPRPRLESGSWQAFSCDNPRMTGERLWSCDHWRDLRESWERLPFCGAWPRCTALDALGEP